MDYIETLLAGTHHDALVQYQGNVWLHHQVIKPFTQLSEQAANEGIKLEIASGFRSFERQLAIWNAKACGEKPVLDETGIPIPPGSLNDESLMWAMLRWSALPGTSRHHWGTDIDVWDCAAVASDYSLELVAKEYSSDGPFARLAHWLTLHLQSPGCDFYRPYAQDRGGVMPEPWHLSYKPLADRYLQQLDAGKIIALLCQTDICLKQPILENITEIMDRFVLPC